VFVHFEEKGWRDVVIYLSVTEKGVDSMGVKKGMCAISVHHSDPSTSQKVDQRKPGEQSTHAPLSDADPVNMRIQVRASMQ